MEARPQALRNDMDLDGNPFSDIVNEPWIDDSSIELEQSALVEAWLDRLLSKILSTATSQSAPMFGESGLKRTGLDRKKLTEIGLEPAEIDSLYRCLYLYSVGMYRLLVDMELDQETEEKVMAAFKLLTSYLPKLGIEASMSNASYQPKTKLEVSYKQLANKIEMERLAWKEEKEDLDAEIEAQRFHASQKEQDYLDSQEILKRREQELQKCRKDLKDARAANDSLKAVMIRHEEELMRLHEECPDDVKELVRLREENEKAAKRLADTERKLRITADELEDAAFNTAALNKVREANDKFAARLAVLEKDLSSRNKELASTKEQIEKIDKENYALNELYHEEATRCAALRLRLQELAEDKEMGQRSNLQAKLLSDIEVLQARVQQLLVENEKFRSQGSNPTELEGLRFEREGTFKENMLICDACTECEDLEQKSQRKSTEENVNQQTVKRTDVEVVAEFKSIAQAFFSQLKTGEVEDISLIKLENSCQLIQAETMTICCDKQDEGTLTESNENMVSLEAFEILTKQLDSSNQALDMEMNIHRSLEEKLNKSNELIHHMELAYQELLVSNQALRSEVESTKLNLQSTSSSVSLLKFELQEEKKAHAQTTLCLSALKTDRMNDMERHSKSVDELTKHFVVALEDEKTAHTTTQAHLSQTLAAMQQQSDSFMRQEEENILQINNYKTQISIIVNEFQNTVTTLLFGIETIHKAVSSDDEGNDKETGSFWKGVEVASIISDEDSRLTDQIKETKHITEVKTRELVEHICKVVPELKQNLEAMKQLSLTLERQLHLCGFNIKQLTKQLWISWYSGLHSTKASREIIKETIKTTLEFWKTFGDILRRNDCSTRYSKIIRSLEEAKSRLEIQMDGSSGLGQTLCDIYLRVTGVKLCETDGDFAEHLKGKDENVFAALDAGIFFKDVIDTLQLEEYSIKEKLDLELEIARLKAKLKSEQVSRIWRDKYIRDLVIKYNAQFDSSSQQ